MSSGHNIPSRTDSQDNSALLAPIAPAGVIPFDHANWQFRNGYRKPKAAKPIIQPEALDSIPVAEIVAKITALGLPGDPHPERTTAHGTVYKAPGRAKQAETKRRGARIRFLEELKNLPVDEPLPIALTAKAQELLARRAKGVS